MKKRILYNCVIAVLSLVLAGQQAIAMDKAEKAAAETHAGCEKGLNKVSKSENTVKQVKEGTATVSEEAAQGAQAVEEEAQKAEENVEE